MMQMDENATLLDQFYSYKEATVLPTVVSWHRFCTRKIDYKIKLCCIYLARYDGY